MKEFLTAHTHIGSFLKSCGFTFTGFAFITISDLAPLYQGIAALIGFFILVLSAINSWLDWQHKKRREKEEKKYGYKPDSTNPRDDSDI